MKKAVLGLVMLVAQVASAQMLGEPEFILSESRGELISFLAVEESGRELLSCQRLDTNKDNKPDVAVVYFHLVPPLDSMGPMLVKSIVSRFPLSVCDDVDFLNSQAIHGVHYSSLDTVLIQKGDELIERVSITIAIEESEVISHAVGDHNKPRIVKVPGVSLTLSGEATRELKHLMD